MCCLCVTFSDSATGCIALSPVDYGRCQMYYQKHIYLCALFATEEKWFIHGYVYVCIYLSNYLQF